MNSAKGAALALGGAIVIIGWIIYYAADQYASENQGPGSGDEVTVEEPTGPGSGEEVDRGNGPGEPGPGSG
ncbi:hypothetical protein C0583_01535 [Candidatus Parcubacteria bacterium]|nr:MAG: hypothetical protein C0583_01535 [Candidatus Parcubacteria bacterium]